MDGYRGTRLTISIPRYAVDRTFLTVSCLSIAIRLDYSTSIHFHGYVSQDLNSCIHLLPIPDIPSTSHHNRFPLIVECVSNYMLLASCPVLCIIIMPLHDFQSLPPHQRETIFWILDMPLSYQSHRIPTTHVLYITTLFSSRRVES